MCAGVVVTVSVLMADMHSQTTYIAGLVYE